MPALRLINSRIIKKSQEGNGKWCRRKIRDRQNDIKEEARQRKEPMTKGFPNDDDVAQFLKAEAHLGGYE